MPDQHNSGQKRRALLRLFQPSFEHTFPIAEPDTVDRELHALLNEADQRRKPVKPGKEDMS